MIKTVRVVLATVVCAVFLATSIGITLANEGVSEQQPVVTAPAGTVTEQPGDTVTEQPDQPSEPADQPEPAPAPVQPVDQTQRVKKAMPTVGEIRGTITGLDGSHQVTVELRRRENKALVPVATTRSDEQGRFSFQDVPHGEYVVTPDLTALPAGYGLYQRHAFAFVRGHKRTVEFSVGKISRLEISAGEELVVGEDQPFVVETAAYDSQGQYLFAVSEIEAPEATSAISKSNNGARFSLKGKGSSHVIRARNGEHTATIRVHVGGKGKGKPANEAPEAELEPETTPSGNQ